MNFIPKCSLFYMICYFCRGLKASTLTLGREIENGRETKSFIENMRGHADAVKNERNNFKEKIEKIDLEMKNGLVSLKVCPLVHV